MPTPAGKPDAALDAFDVWTRPLVDRIQDIPKGIVHFVYPQTRTGLALHVVADKVLTTALFTRVMARLIRVADSDRPLLQIPVATRR